MPAVLHTAKGTSSFPSSLLRVNQTYSTIHKAAPKTVDRQQLLNTKRQAKERRFNLIYDVVNTWIKPESNIKLTRSGLKEYLNCIKQLIHLMGYRYTRNLMIPTVIYADRSIDRTGLLSTLKDLFRLLLTSALVTVKMWEDCGIDSQLIEDMVGIPRKELSIMERQFLHALDYSLFLTEADVADFHPRNRTQIPKQVETSS